MTDHSKRPTLALPAEIIAELRAANAKHVADCDGFDGGAFQLWTTARGPLLVLLTPDDEDVVFFRPLGRSPTRSPRNLGRILREQDNEPDNTGAENGSLDSNNADPHESKNWEQFEERVKHIYSVLLNIKGEKVSVSRDVKLIGRDGLIHQFDVYYEFSRAGVNHRVAIECRDKSRPLDKDAVMAFRSKVSDIPGLQGLMVSAKGYQSGAKKFANDNGIIALTMDELPGVGRLLAIRLENVTCPTKDNVGEPFWSIYEIDEDGEANGNLYGRRVDGQQGALLFFSKKLCEEFLSRETVGVQARYGVFGLTQLNLRCFIAMADCFAASFYLAFDVQPSPRLGDITVGLVQIPRETLIEYYVLGDHGLPKEPMVMPNLRGSSDKEPPSATEAPDVIHLPPPRDDRSFP
jgi:Restriction endonuclease